MKTSREHPLKGLKSPLPTTNYQQEGLSCTPLPVWSPLLPAIPADMKTSTYSIPCWHEGLHWQHPPLRTTVEHPLTSMKPFVASTPFWYEELHCPCPLLTWWSLMTVPSCWCEELNCQLSILSWPQTPDNKTLHYFPPIIPWNANNPLTNVCTCQWNVPNTLP